jgi:hypothetical protein
MEVLHANGQNTLMIMCQWNNAKLPLEKVTNAVLMQLEMIWNENNACFSNWHFPTKIQIDSSEKCTFFMMRICEI